MFGIYVVNSTGVVGVGYMFYFLQAPERRKVREGEERGRKRAERGEQRAESREQSQRKGNRDCWCEGDEARGKAERGRKRDGEGAPWVQAPTSSILSSGAIPEVF